MPKTIHDMNIKYEKAEKSINMKYFRPPPMIPTSGNKSMTVNTIPISTRIRDIVLSLKFRVFFFFFFDLAFVFLDFPAIIHP